MHIQVEPLQIENSHFYRLYLQLHTENSTLPPRDVTAKKFSVLDVASTSPGSKKGESCAEVSTTYHTEPEATTAQSMKLR